MANNIQYPHFIERERQFYIEQFGYDPVEREQQQILANRNEESRIAVHNYQCILQGRQDYRNPGPFYFPAEPMLFRVVSHIFDKESSLRQPIDGGLRGGLQPDEVSLLNLVASGRDSLMNKTMLISPQEWKPIYQRMFAKMQQR